MAAQWAGPLPLDVWNLVFDDLDKHSDVLSLMRTCGLLYVLGIRRLLGLFYCFDDVSVLRSFCDFVLSDIARRPGYLRLFALAIELPRLRAGDHAEEEEEEADVLHVIPALAQVLARATGLEELRIGYAEELLQRADISIARGCCPPNLRLCTIIASMHSVTALQLASFGAKTAFLLQTTSSPLLMLDINFYDTHPNAYPDCIPYLINHRATLTIVSVWHAHMGPPVVTPAANAPRFPLVRDLRLRKVVWPSLPVLLHAFPNLSFLHYTSPEVIHGAIVNNALVVREMNRSAPAAVSWPTLQHLCGGLDALFVLGVTGRRHRVEITDFDLYLTFARMLNVVLLDVIPTHLILHIGYLHGVPPLERRLDLVTFLQHVPSPLEVTHLQLFLHPRVLFSAGGQPYDLINLGLVKAAILPFRRLRFFTLYVCRDDAGDLPTSETDMDREPIVSIAHLEKLALDIATAHPALEGLFINPYFAVQGEGWAVARSPTSTTLRRLFAQDMWDLVQTEKLYETGRPTHPRPIRVVADLAGADEIGVDDGAMRNLPTFEVYRSEDGEM